MVIRSNFRQLTMMSPAGTPVEDQRKPVDHLNKKQVEDDSSRRVEGAIDNDAAFFALHEGALGEGAVEHLTEDQVAQYVDKNLAGEDLQIATDHLANCDLCVFMVEDIRAFRNEIAPSLDRDYRPAAVAAAPEAKSRRSFLSLFRVSPVPAFAGAALVLVLLTMIAWIVWRTPLERE